MTAVAIDAEGNPARPAANWLDGRASERVNDWNADGRAKKVLEVTGTTIFGGLFPVLIEELAETEPEVVAKAQTHLNCKDWIRFKLTGERLTDYTEASRSFLDVRDADLVRVGGGTRSIEVLNHVARDSPPADKAAGVSGF